MDPLAPLTILTVGHSTRALDELLALLTAHGVARLVDIRTVPRSRHNPQFNREALPAPLEAAGIVYEHMPGLGGLRRARPDSVNTGWRNASFRGYADYMQTPEFAESVTALIARASHDRAAVMCAEAVPWRCHRSLLSDALLVRGLEAREILDSTRLGSHVLTPFARVNGTVLTYPAGGPQMTLRLPVTT